MASSLVLNSLARPSVSATSARPQSGMRVGTVAPAVRIGSRASAMTTRRVVTRASRDGGGGAFIGGFLLGGAVFGTLGFLFAPEISRRLLGENDGIRMPRFLDDDDGSKLEVTRQSLNEKIAQLNDAIDDVSSQLNDGDEPGEESAAGTA